MKKNKVGAKVNKHNENGWWEMNKNQVGHWVMNDVAVRMKKNKVGTEVSKHENGQTHSPTPKPPTKHLSC